MFGLNYVLTYTAETQLPSGLVAVLFGTMPFFVFAFAHGMVGERASRATLLGALLALGGVAVISLVGNVRGDALYVAAAVGASALSGFANVYLKRHAHAEPLATLPPAMLAAGLGMCVWGGALERIDWHAALQPAPVAAVAYLAVCGSALAFYLNHWLLQRIDSGVMGLSALLIPVIGRDRGSRLRARGSRSARSDRRRHGDRRRVDIARGRRGAACQRPRRVADYRMKTTRSDLALLAMRLVLVRRS